MVYASWVTDGTRQVKRESNRPFAVVLFLIIGLQRLHDVSQPIENITEQLCSFLFQPYNKLTNTHQS